jgi:hypothetical protein
MERLTEDTCLNSNQVPTILLLCKATRPALCQIQLFIQYVEEVKREAASSPSLNIEVKNVWSHTSTPYAFMAHVYRGNFILPLFYTLIHNELFPVVCWNTK